MVQFLVCIIHSQPNCLNISIVKISYKCQSINESPRYKKFKTYTELFKCFISPKYFSVQCNNFGEQFFLLTITKTCLQIKRLWAIWNENFCVMVVNTSFYNNIIIKYWYEQFLIRSRKFLYTRDWKINVHIKNIRVLWPMLQEPTVVPFLNYWFHLVTDGKHVQCHCLLLSCRRNGRICLPFLWLFLWYLLVLLPAKKISW